jgi:hypothetical protein
MLEDNVVDLVFRPGPELGSSLHHRNPPHYFLRHFRESTALPPPTLTRAITCTVRSAEMSSM